MSGRVLVVLQSRMSSSRLPAKALLPLAGTTVVSLAARRAANTALPLVVATSADASDDPLAAHLAAEGLSVHRGSLDDVLGRFHEATRELADDDVVVRLTADNVLPDGAFVDELVRARAERGDTYLATRYVLDGLPHGLCGEAFTVAALRAAARTATSTYDREHVTPWIERTYGTPIFRPAFANAPLSHLRCTLDTFADYLRLCRLFAGVTQPVRVPAAALIERLARLPGEPAFRVPYRVVGDAVHSALALDLRPLDSSSLEAREARRVVTSAIAHGVNSIETTNALETAAARAGMALSGGLNSQAGLVALLDFTALADDAAVNHVHAAVDAAVLGVCHALRVTALAAVVVDRSHQRALDAALSARLREWQTRGVIERLGASVGTPEQAMRVLQDESLAHLRIALDAGHDLDAWHSSPVPQRLRERPGTIVHVSSAQLDAALEAGPDRLADARWSIRQLLTCDFVTSVVAGARNPDQLSALLELFRSATETAAS